MRHIRLSDQPCPIARSLDVTGKWRTLPRDALLGARRFEIDPFRATGIAENILSARLKKLVDEGIFERRPTTSASCVEDPVRYQPFFEPVVRLHALRRADGASAKAVG